MKAIDRALALAATAALAIGCTLAAPVAPAEAQMPVIDAANYAQNLLQAARALQQIGNQVKSLQNEAAMLENMDRNLKPVDFPQIQKIAAAMSRIDQLMGEAQAVRFKVDGLDRQIEGLFPGALSQALTADRRVLQARAQLDAATDSYKRTMTVQAQVAENVEADLGTLEELAATSQGAVGSLQVGQAANQLLALSVKQQLQVQQLMASEYRASALDRARRVQAEEDGRATTRRFLEGPAGN